jgi:hypothetical protein
MLIVARKGVGIEVNAEETCMCCCLVTRMQGKIMTEIANRFFGILALFNYLGTTITNQYFIQGKLRGDEIWIMHITFRAFCLWFRMGVNSDRNMD